MDSPFYDRRFFAKTFLERVGTRNISISICAMITLSLSGVFIKEPYNLWIVGNLMFPVVVFLWCIKYPGKETNVLSEYGHKYSIYILHPIVIALISKIYREWQLNGWAEVIKPIFVILVTSIMAYTWLNIYSQIKTLR